MNRVRQAAPVHFLARLYNWSVPLEHDALQMALELGDVRRGERVLDVATGTGAMLRELARRNACPGTVVGVDRSRSMVSGASGLAAPFSLVVADARALPFPDASFDVISVCYLVHLLQPNDRRRVFEAVRRLVRPGGRMVTVTVDSEHPALRWLLGVLPIWTSLRRLDPRPDLETAGLRPVQARYAGPAGHLCACSPSPPEAQPHLKGATSIGRVAWPC